MKTKIICIIMSVLLVLQLCGCGKDTEDSPGASSVEEPQSVSGEANRERPAAPESILDVSAISELSRRDNSLDAYSWIMEVPLRPGDPVKEIGGKTRFFLGKSRAFCYRKHLFASSERCWDEIVCAAAGRETETVRFDAESQLWGIGPVSGTDHYIALLYTVEEDGNGEEIYRYFVEERDESHGTLKKLPLNFLEGGDSFEAFTGITDLAADSSGAVHLVQNSEEGWRYLLVSPEGDVLTEYSPVSGDFLGFVPLYDGCLAFWETEGDPHRMRLRYLDSEKGRAVTLAAPEKDIYGCTLLDENTLLYADQEGLYCSALSGDNPELLYLWVNHGILLSGISAMEADQEGRISIVYQDSSGGNYLCLEPTTEEVEIRQITLALSRYNSNREFYKTAVAAFNRKYPTCHIEIAEEYDRTVLLTELTAGKGPVLIDAFLTGFEEQEKLWEPLDTVMGQLGVTEELLPAALELGRINGILYGVAMDFELNTVVTGDPELEDWDYETFLQCVEDRPELESIYNFYGGNYATLFIMNFLSHGIEDNYLMDAEAGTTNFDSDGFRKVLAMAKKYCVREEGVRPGKTVLSGKVLCNELTVNKPEQMALYRVCYGENASYIGYPARDGGAHYIRNSYPLAVRRSASKEEKETACAFIATCLSHEVQSKAKWNLNFSLSVRRDVLEEQIAAMNKHTTVYASGFDEFVIGEDLNRELDGKMLFDLLEKAKPRKYFPEELQDILFEELELYFDDVITEDMLIEHLTSRVGVYLGERN